MPRHHAVSRQGIRSRGHQRGHQADPVPAGPHIATSHKGLLNATANEQAIPVQAKFSAPVSQVSVRFWASTGCPAKLEAFDASDRVVDTAAVAAAPSRQSPGEPVPFFALTVKAPAIAYIRFSGPRNGEFLAADEIRYRPANGE